MVITSANKTRRGKIALAIDGEFLCSVDAFAWASSGLRPGSEVNEEILNGLLGESLQQQAKRRALHMLSARRYTARQLTDRLAEKSGRAAAEAAVDRMTELGYVNDDDYARDYARELYESRRYALRRIRHELTKRGIDREIADDAVAFIDPEDERPRALALVRDKFGRVADESTRRRALSLLERYGYRGDAISAALRSARTDEEDGEDGLQ